MNSQYNSTLLRHNALMIKKVFVSISISKEINHIFLNNIEPPFLYLLSFYQEKTKITAAAVIALI